MRVIALLASIAVSVAGFAPAGAAQSVHVVDDGGGGDFTRIVDAVAAAADGDLVLVKDGVYANEGTIALGAGALTIFAEAGASVSVTAKFQVTGLAAGKNVALRGLTVQNGVFSLCFEATNCAGNIWLEDCSFTGFPASFFDDPDPVVLSDCASVVVCDCTITAGTGINGLSGGSAIRSFRTDLFLEGSVLTGGEGAQIPSTLDGDVGGAGLTMEDGRLIAGDGSITGGVGGEGGVAGVCTDSGDGGVGLHLTGTDPAATLRGVQLAGGAAGLVTGVGSCSQGQDGSSSQVDAGTLGEFPWPLHDMEVTSPVRTDEFAVATFSGPPGESIWIGLSVDPGSFFVPALNGVLYHSASITVRFVGVLDAAGSATYMTPVTLGSMVNGDVVTAQALFFDSVAGQFTLGTPSSVTILDPMF